MNKSHVTHRKSQVEHECPRTAKVAFSTRTRSGTGSTSHRAYLPQYEYNIWHKNRRYTALGWDSTRAFFPVQECRQNISWVDIRAQPPDRHMLHIDPTTNLIKKRSIATYTSQRLYFDSL